MRDMKHPLSLLVRPLDSGLKDANDVAATNAKVIARDAQFLQTSALGLWLAYFSSNCPFFFIE